MILSHFIGNRPQFQLSHVIFDVGTRLIPPSWDARVTAILVLEAHLGCIPDG